VLAEARRHVDAVAMCLVVIMGSIGIILNYELSGINGEIRGLRSEFVYKKLYEQIQKDLEQQRACYLKMKNAWMEQREETGKLKAQLATAKKGRR
jgi:hypothetical protein